jgi:hypothetical protein
VASAEGDLFFLFKERLIIVINVEVVWSFFFYSVIQFEASITSVPCRTIRIGYRPHWVSGEYSCLATLTKKVRKKVRPIQYEWMDRGPLPFISADKRSRFTVSL